jgi:hypothetical protein
VKFNNLKKSTVHDVKQRYYYFIAAGGLLEEFSSDGKTLKRRSHSLGVDVIARLQVLFNQHLSRSMRSLTWKLKINGFVVRKKMGQDIRYKLYALRRGRFMSQATKERRLEKVK